MPGAASARSVGLPGLRRSGAVTELLFLYECLTTEPTQLRPIADELGLTVQAVSHSYRQLSRRGLAEVREGRYHATVAGVAWLHEALGHVGEDVRRRLERLHVVRSCRAVALDDLHEGDAVSLELRDGLLSARKGGPGPSRGRTASAARRGSLVEVADLEGIVPLTRAPVSARTLSVRDLHDPQLASRIRRANATLPDPGLLAAVGLEAYQMLRGTTSRPVIRFAVAAAAGEASRLGVPSTVWLMDTDLPRFLAEFSGPDPPPLDVRPLRDAGGRSRKDR
jgi:putative transcriptional regulator